MKNVKRISVIVCLLILFINTSCFAADDAHGIGEDADGNS